MKLLVSSKIKMVLVGFVVALMIGGGGSANAEFIIGTPTNLGPTVNSSSHEGSPSISADDLSLYFTSYRPGGYGDLDIWVTTRATIDDPWGTAVNLGTPINSSVAIWGVSISSDGLSLYFDRGASGDIYVATRATTDDNWGNPVHLGPTVNSPNDDSVPNISADELSLYFNSRRGGGQGKSDLWVTTRPTTDDPWGTPVNLGPTVNSSAEDVSPSISADGLQLFFNSDRPGGYGQVDIYVTTRATTDDPWGTAVNLGPPVNSSMWEGFPSISADGSTLYLSSDLPGGSGGWDLWQVSITTVIDFNGDGRVDFKDFSILAQYWLQDESSVDIGPTPLGDDMVDFKDIVVFAENWLAGTRRASNPHPYNGARNVDINADLSWTAGADATSHDVYFGTSPTPAAGEFQGNQTATTFDPCTMAYNTTYYWRIDEVGAWGTTTGTVWSFTTITLEATNPKPADGATDVSLNTDLSWTAGADAESHDVYFGTTSPGTFIGNQTAKTFDPGTMTIRTTYYWRIDEVNASGTTTGTVWSFTTESGPPPL